METLTGLFGLLAGRKPYTEDLADDGPVSLPYHRNTTPAPRKVNHYHGQDIEPHGQYFTPTALHESRQGPDFEHGTKSFHRPLRLYSPTDDPGHPDHWKQQLSRRYQGKKGKALSQAVAKDGYDAILTHDDYGPSECVDLSSFTPRHQATLTQIFAAHGVQDGDEVPSHLLNAHGRTVRALVGGYDNVEMVPTSILRRYAAQETTAEHAKEVGQHVAHTGQIEPVILHYHPASGEAYLGEGNHRLRASRSLQMPALPTRVIRSSFGLPGPGTPVPQRHPEEGRGHVPYDIRPSDLGLTSLRTEAAADKPEIHRSLALVLPPDKHAFVHDTGQPRAARAHMLLSEIKKQTPQIANEHLQGGTGGLGEFWTPHEEKAKQFTNGWSAYRNHEREHSCGDPDYGEGGCRTTHVIMHAQEPSEKHHWEDVYHPGEKYDRDVSWRLPVRPGAPLKVNGISWGEGDDHKPVLDQKTGADFQRYDFASPVHKQAGANGDLPEGLTFEHREYPRYYEHRITARHPDFPDHPGYGSNYAGHIAWFGDDPTGCDNREISAIDVHPNLQRRGLATELFRRAKEITPDIHHSKNRTADGRAWSATTASYQHQHEWLPSGHYWGPNSPHPDQRLFDGDKLRPEVRKDVLERLGAFFDKHGYQGWDEWAKVYFAGSEAAKWVSEDGTGNGDFDILIGIHWPVFRREHPEFADKNDLQVTTAMTDGLWKEANVSDYYFTLADGRRVGPFEVTFFANPIAWDVRKIHPYAAYDVTDDRWAVHPLKVSADWSAQSLPESYWDYAEAMGHAVQAIGGLPPEERARMARNLWEEIHTHRSDAFADGGKGLFDLSNVTEKYLDQHPDGLWNKLRAWKHDAPSSITQEAAVRNNLKDSDPDGADYQGIMIALVPPKDVCEDLAVEGGEPVDTMHVTLAYLGGKDEHKPEDLAMLPDLVKAWAATQKPLKASVGGVGTFVHPTQHVLWAAVDLPHGTKFRDSLVDLLEEHGYGVRNDHGWTPHVTISYGTSHFRFMPKITPVSWDVTEVWCCVGGRWESFPIGG